MQTDELIIEWKAAKALLDSSKAEEMILRKSIIARLFNRLDWGANKVTTAHLHLPLNLAQLWGIDK